MPTQTDRTAGDGEGHQSKRVLEELYYRQNFAITEIADRFDIDKSTVQYWMDKHNLERDRSATFERRWRRRPPQFRVHPGGYERWRDGRREDTVYVHQMLAIAEGADPERVFGDGYEIHHKNGIPWDNRPENVRVIETTEHRQMHGKSGGMNDVE